WPHGKRTLVMQAASRRPQPNKASVLRSLASIRIRGIRRGGAIAMRPTRKTMLIVFGLATVVVLERLSLGSQSGPDLLEQQSKQLAGPDAIDCGKGVVHGDPN